PLEFSGTDTISDPVHTCFRYASRERYTKTARQAHIPRWLRSCLTPARPDRPERAPGSPTPLCDRHGRWLPGVLVEILPGWAVGWYGQYLFVWNSSVLGVSGEITTSTQCLTHARPSVEDMEQSL